MACLKILSILVYSVKLSEVMSQETTYISDGKSLGLEKSELVAYVKKRKEEFAADEVERHNEERDRRAHERDMKKMETDLAMARIAAGNPVLAESVTTNKSYVKLTNYKDDEDIAVYLKIFERVTEANSWSPKVAMSALQNGFSGTKVSMFMNSLPAAMEYREVKVELIRSFGFTVYDYQKNFRHSKQGVESFRQFVLMMKDNLSKMCELSEVNLDYGKLTEMIIKDQILGSVSSSLSEYLKERNLFSLTLDETVELSENYQAIHGKGLVRDNYNFVNSDYGGAKQKTCYLCGKPGHVSRFCQAKTINYVAKSEGPENLSGVPDSSMRGCYNCGKLGHSYRQCTVTREKNVQPGAITVNSVSGANKNYDDSLPVNFGLCNGKSAKILRDTGTTIVLVRTEFCKKSQLIGEYITLKFADGHIASAPKVKVYIKCPYFTGYTDAVCVDNLQFDVLIGNIPGALCACQAYSGGMGEHSSAVCAVQTRAQVANEHLPMPESKASCGSIEFNLETMNARELSTLQKSDPKLSSFYDKANKIESNYPKFLVQNELLIRLCMTGKNTCDVVRQILLPVELKSRVLRLGHDSLFSGHLGIRKTQDRILSHFWWPGCYSDIRRYCRSCATCQLHANNRPAKVPLVVMPVISKPFSRVAIDLIGPLPKSHRGNRYALVSIDLATKYPDAVPLRHIDSGTVSEALMEIFSRVGLPNEILHDQGTQFISSTMKKFNQLLQIKGIRTSPYNPRCNGSCENFNKTLKQMLRKVSSDSPQTWDRYLQPLLFAYREVPQITTGFSPFELLFGHEVRGPLFLIKERLLDLECEHEEIPVTAYVLEMREKLREFIKLSNENEMLNKKKEKVYYDRNCRKRKLNVGDKVLLLLPTSTSKLLAEWKGPYEVVRKLNKVDYVIRVGDVEKTYHVNMLKQFKDRPVELVNSIGLAENIDYKINDDLSMLIDLIY